VAGPGFACGVAVSPDGSRVYAGNMSGTLDIIDTATATLATTSLPNFGAIYGFALSPDGTRGYVLKSQDNKFAVIDTATNTVLTEIFGVSSPYGIVASKTGSTVYVANSNFQAGSVTVIDTATNTVTGNISVGPMPKQLALSPDGTKLYVTNTNSGAGSNSVSVIDTAWETVVDTLTGFAAPYGIAASATRLYAGNQNTNTLSVVDVDPMSATYNTLIATLNVGSQPFGVTLTPNGSQVWVATPMDGNVKVIDTASSTLWTPVTGVGLCPAAVALSSNGVHGAGVSWDQTTSLLCYAPTPPPG